MGNLGSATAHAFQSAGASTVLVDRSLERLRAAFPGPAESPEHFLAGGVDLSEAGSLEKLTGDTLKRFGRIDALVHTVGAWRGGKPVHETDVSDWGFRVLILPGTILLWPLLARRWMKGVHEPPEENSPHRYAARGSCRNRPEEAHSRSLTSSRPGMNPHLCEAWPTAPPPGAEKGEKASP
jgi:NAD(P)-dependent dehydrogenase (short-subunit alcohol dehydrogenase family)